MQATVTTILTPLGEIEPGKGLQMFCGHESDLDRLLQILEAIIGFSLDQSPSFEGKRAKRSSSSSRLNFLLGTSLE
jgi:hypothetical protein